MGAGYVELIEIPTTVEIHDNIAAYWKPANGPAPGTPFQFGYRMYWTDDAAHRLERRHRRRDAGRPRQARRYDKFVVDFAGSAVADMRQMPVAVVTANPGTVSDIAVHNNPETNGVRVSFELDPGGTELSELRLSLRLGDQQISETWLYRWTKS